MAINETISTGNKYRRLKDATNKVWQRLSFWTKASDVEFDNGYTAQATLGNITGITDSVNSSASNVAASANAVYQLNSNLNSLSSTLSTQNSRINLYVGSDGKLHFVNKDGADTALNFSSVNSASYVWNTTFSSDYTSTVSYSIPKCTVLIIAPNDSRVSISRNFSVSSAIQLPNPNYAYAFYGVSAGSVTMSNSGGGGCQGWALAFS